MEILPTFGKYGKSAKLKGRNVGKSGNDGNAEMAEISIKYGNVEKTKMFLKKQEKLEKRK